MIDFEEIEKKLKPLNDRIEEINLKLGLELSEELLSRIKVTVDSFFEDFKSLSAKSFERYWIQVEESKASRFSDDLHNGGSKDDLKTEMTGIPKFISDYDRNKDKK